MGMLDKLKELAPAAGQLAGKLGLNKKVTDALEGLMKQLEALNNAGKLDDIAKNAISSFQPVLEKCKASNEMDELLQKGKAFLEKLSSADLPEEIKGLVSKAKQLLG